MTKEDAFREINNLQDYYVTELISRLNAPEYAAMKTLSFTSATGTGKTKMMSKLINKYPDYYFIVTTLSRGQLHHQIRENLNKDCNQNNFTVYGSQDYRINSRLEAVDIIERIPQGTRCVWLRDEGHIKTNRYEELLQDVCWKVINFSATNESSTVLCNFTQTMMLRTVNQIGDSTPKDAIEKLLEIKKAHKRVKNYNPCAIFRCVSGDCDIYTSIIKCCEENNLKYIDITDEDFIMSDLCKDDNEYDVIINKMKIVEGIDIRRAHVLFMDNRPSNNNTTIQIIGRCRRNALLYREDIDILAKENECLLKHTRECYVYYHEDMSIDKDETGELQAAFCNYISVEKLKCNTEISVIDGQMQNGLYVIELKGKTGTYSIKKDQNTGFNVVYPCTDYYSTKLENLQTSPYVFCKNGKILRENIPLLPFLPNPPTYFIQRTNWKKNQTVSIPDFIKEKFSEFKTVYNEDYLKNILLKHCIDNLVLQSKTKHPKIQTISKYIEEYFQYSEEFGINKILCKQLRSLTNNKLLSLYSYEAKYDIPGDIENIKIGFSSLNQYCLLLLVYCCIKIKESCNASFQNILYYQCIVFETIYKMNYNANENEAICANLILVIYDLYKRDTDLKIEFYPILRLHSVAYCDYNEKPNINENDFSSWFVPFFEFIKKQKYYYSFEPVYEMIVKEINDFEYRIKNNIIDNVCYSYDRLFKKISQKDNPQEYKSVLYQWELNTYKSYKKVKNDFESSVIGTDLMHQYKDYIGNVHWCETSSVTSKISSHTKLNTFISRKYIEEIEQAQPFLFFGKNNFELDSRCNSMLGYCVEYYSKYLIYGKLYLERFYYQAEKEINDDNAFSKMKNIDNEILNDCKIIRACILKYKSMMTLCYGSSVSRFIRAMSLHCMTSKYLKFVEIVKNLGIKTANYVKQTLYLNKEPVNNIDPNLSIDHISGLADYITEDTILDIKVRNTIDEKNIKQVLAYHYLSTKRSDLHIRRVIVYDATSGRDVIIDITDKNQSDNSL